MRVALGHLAVAGFNCREHAGRGRLRTCSGVKMAKVTPRPRWGPQGSSGGRAAEPNRRWERRWWDRTLLPPSVSHDRSGAGNFMSPNSLVGWQHRGATSLPRGDAQLWCGMLCQSLMHWAKGWCSGRNRATSSHRLGTKGCCLLPWICRQRGVHVHPSEGTEAW